MRHEEQHDDCELISRIDRFEENSNGTLISSDLQSRNIIMRAASPTHEQQHPGHGAKAGDS